MFHYRMFIIKIFAAINAKKKHWDALEVTEICSVCKQSFKTTIFAMQKSERNFCSVMCKHIGAAEQKTVFCDCCYKKITRKHSLIGEKNYCNIKCFNDRLETKRFLKCSFCEKKLLRSRCQVRENKTGLFFCSNKCRGNYSKIKKVRCECDGLECQNVFYRYLNYIKKNNFCSRKCADEFNLKELKECSFCEKNFFVFPSKAKKKQLIFLFSRMLT